jgi:hypothetical protein
MIGAAERPGRPAIRVAPEDLPPRKPRSRRKRELSRRLDRRVEREPLRPDSPIGYLTNR